MAIDRTTLIRGPAIITWNTYEYYSKDDIVVKFGMSTFDVNTSAMGKVDERLDDRMIEVSFTPVGEWEAASKVGLFPGGSAAAGSSWFGASDLPLVITCIDGTRKLTLHNAQITKIPSLLFGATKTLIGPVTFRAINVNNVEWSNAAAVCTEAAGTGSASSFTNFSAIAVLTQGYTAAWGAITGFTALNSVDGFQADFDLSLVPVTVDSIGLVDYTFDKLDLTLKCQPIGPTTAQMIAALEAGGMQGTGAARGKSLNATPVDHNFVISSATVTPFFTARNMSLVSADINYGTQSLRHGECVWKSIRKFTTGTLDAVFTIA
jgi:hypothetical protein